MRLLATISSLSFRFSVNIDAEIDLVNRSQYRERSRGIGLKGRQVRSQLEHSCFAVRDKGFKVIDTGADTLRILADCRPFLKRLLPFEGVVRGKVPPRKPREGLRF